MTAGAMGPGNLKPRPTSRKGQEADRAETSDRAATAMPRRNPDKVSPTRGRPDTARSHKRGPVPARGGSGGGPRSGVQSMSAGRGPEPAEVTLEGRRHRTPERLRTRVVRLLRKGGGRRGRVSRTVEGARAAGTPPHDGILRYPPVSGVRASTPARPSFSVRPWPTPPLRSSFHMPRLGMEREVRWRGGRAEHLRAVPGVWDVLAERVRLSCGGGNGAAEDIAMGGCDGVDGVGPLDECPARPVKVGAHIRMAEMRKRESWILLTFEILQQRLVQRDRAGVSILPVQQCASMV
jgi:hypothetical protein